MSKFKLLFPSLLSAALCASAQDEDEGWVATPIQYTCTYTLPKAKDLRFFIGQKKTGCEISYMIEGDSIIDIDKESLKITSVTTEDGKDITAFALDARDRNPYPPTLTYFNHPRPFFHRMNEPKFTTFSVFVETEAPLTIPKIKGTVTAKIAKGAEFANLTFKTDEKDQEQAAGPLTFSIATRQKGWQDQFGITVKGNLNLLKSLSVSAGGKTLQQGGNSSTTDTATYYFNTTEPPPEFIVSITYFSDIQDVSVTLGQ